MGGVTLEDFTESVAYKEIFGVGEQRQREEDLHQVFHQGMSQGFRTGELKIILRLLQRRCGALSSAQEIRSASCRGTG
jgi:hypothetical protein